MTFYSDSFLNKCLFKKPFAMLFVALSTLSVSSSQAQEAVLNTDEALNALAQIQSKITPESVIRLPVDGFNAIDYDDQLYFMSNTGRFVIMGQLYDVLAQDFIDSPEVLRDVTERLDFTRLKINFDDLNTYSSGDASKPMVVTFIDPKSDASLETLAEMEKLKSEYSFKYVPIPAFGEESNVLTKKLACATDKEAAFKALLAGKLEKFNSSVDCANNKNDLTLLTAHMLRIDGVPFTVAPNGSIARGSVQNLEPWLKDNVHKPLN